MKALAWNVSQTILFFNAIGLLMKLQILNKMTLLKLMIDFLNIDCTEIGC